MIPKGTTVLVIKGKDYHHTQIGTVWQLAQDSLDHHLYIQLYYIPGVTYPTAQPNMSSWHISKDDVIIFTPTDLEKVIYGL